MRERNGLGRRRFLATTGAAFAGGVAGCSALPGRGDGNAGEFTWSTATFRGSGPLVSSRPAPGGTSIRDLPDLSGTLTLYLGGGESGLYVALLDILRKIYPEFTLDVRTASSSSHAQTIVQEHEAQNTRADVFLAIDAGSLGYVADNGAARDLSSDVRSMVARDHFKTAKWVGIEGRARTIPFNTNSLTSSDIPDDVMTIPQRQSLASTMGWAPAYGAFQAFITAMRLTAGEDATRQWLNGMLDAGVTRYPDEFLVSNAVADGEVAAGFANHYYALRVQNARPDAPIDLAFTKNDAGALVNVSGAEVIEGTENPDLAETFIRHLLSSEAQEFFATRTFGYPMISGVAPVGGLPTIDELNPPEFDLTKLANVQPTLELMRDVGVL